MTLSKQSLILPILNPSELRKPAKLLWLSPSGTSPLAALVGEYSAEREAYFNTWAEKIYETSSFLRKAIVPESTFNKQFTIQAPLPNREMIAAACKWVQFYNSKCTNLLYVRARRLLQSQLSDPVAFKQAFEERKQATYNMMEYELAHLRDAVFNDRIKKLPVEQLVDDVIETATKQLKERERRRNESYTTEGIVDYDRHVLRHRVS